MRASGDGASEANEAGLHGAGSSPGTGWSGRRWFGSKPPAAGSTAPSASAGGWPDRRHGGVGAAGGPVLLVSVHYESHTDPADRVAQTRAMLDAIDAHGPGRPVLIGGDFNTSTFDLPTKGQPERVAAALAEDPQRLVAPMRYEPMFEELRARGYDATACNVPLAPTSAPDPTARRSHLRQDRLALRARSSAPTQRSCRPSTRPARRSPTTRSSSSPSHRPGLMPFQPLAAKRPGPHLRPSRPQHRGP